ncbi:MAG TPA: HAMP domain-containing sensor histidine kinase, partial [Planctomycetota bacterium]|nr:HAMP domain-containing sensor histidine kinase [Planctomycetota bacterium]
QSQLLDLLCQATRAPINSIIGLAGGLLEERSSWSGNDREYIAEIQRCGDYLLSLIEKTFLYLDLEHDAEPRREEVDIERLLASVIREVERLEENRAVEIHVDSEVQGLTVNVERESVARALGAVLDNAVKHSPEGGTVGVDLRIENAELIIAVRDRGPGVPPEEVDSIFQVGVVRERGYPGFGIGLGLPIAKRVAERHGGRLFLDKSSGPGATFVLSLPIGSPVTA